MSLVYSTLKQAILDDTHRPDLSSHVERFIRQGEGMIRRDLQGYVLRTTLTDASRDGSIDSIYTLPTYCFQVKDVRLQGRQGDSLTRVAPGQIQRLDTTADVVMYCQHGDGTVEFAGVPGATDVFDLVYYGMPEPLSDAEPSNDLLSDHEGLYMAASKFYLYLHTQDRELAADELDMFNGVMLKLNEQFAREIGGASIAPTYNFSGGSSY